MTVAAILHDNGIGALAELWTLNTFEDELEEPLLLAKIGRWVGHMPPHLTPTELYV